MADVSLTLEELMTVILVLRAESLGLDVYKRTAIKSAIAKLEEAAAAARTRRTTASYSPPGGEKP